jgi:hypothetical protein
MFTTVTYQDLLQWFTERQLDDAVIIARCTADAFPHLSYEQRLVKVLVEMKTYA